jgi:hypothetical protein
MFGTFDESKHVRNKGKFAPKSGPRTAGGRLKSWANGKSKLAKAGGSSGIAAALKATRERVAQLRNGIAAGPKGAGGGAIAKALASTKAANANRVAPPGSAAANAQLTSPGYRNGKLIPGDGTRPRPMSSGSSKGGSTALRAMVMSGAAAFKAEAGDRIAARGGSKLEQAKKYAGASEAATRAAGDVYRPGRTGFSAKQKGAFAKDTNAAASRFAAKANQAAAESGKTPGAARAKQSMTEGADTKIAAIQRLRASKGPSTKAPAVRPHPKTAGEARAESATKDISEVRASARAKLGEKKQAARSAASLDKLNKRNMSANTLDRLDRTQGPAKIGAEGKRILGFGPAPEASAKAAAADKPKGFGPTPKASDEAAGKRKGQPVGFGSMPGVDPTVARRQSADAPKTAGQARALESAKAVAEVKGRAQMKYIEKKSGDTDGWKPPAIPERQRASIDTLKKLDTLRDPNNHVQPPVKKERPRPTTAGEHRARENEKAVEEVKSAVVSKIQSAHTREMRGTPELGRAVNKLKSWANSSAKAMAPPKKFGRGGGGSGGGGGAPRKSKGDQSTTKSSKHDDKANVPFARSSLLKRKTAGK